jgi:hypothetical protein
MQGLLTHLFKGVIMAHSKVIDEIFEEMVDEKILKGEVYG